MQLPELIGMIIVAVLLYIGFKSMKHYQNKRKV